MTDSEMIVNRVLINETIFLLYYLKSVGLSPVFIYYVLLKKTAKTANLAPTKPDIRGSFDLF